MDKKIYSLNLIAYLKQRGFEEIRKGKDEGTDKIYYCFPVNENVADAIKEYKQDEKLQGFLRKFKEIKTFVRSQQ